MVPPVCGTKLMFQHLTGLHGSSVADGGGLRQMCYAMYELGVWWPETGPGEVRSVKCPWELGQGQFVSFDCNHRWCQP